MDFNAALQSFGHLQGDLVGVLDAWILCFTRVVAFVHFAPIFGRKDIPSPIKISLALFITCALIWLIPRDIIPGSGVTTGNVGWMLVLILVNFTIGFVIAFIATMLKAAIDSAGDLMTNQIGLSSAMTFDPSTKQQVMLLNNLFSMFGAVMFIYLGGMHWLIDALHKSFVIFPLYKVNPELSTQINMDYVVHMSSNVLVVAVQLIAPVIITTLSVDIILGVVNRAAQQMPVFQLSFATKPTVGTILLLLILPIFMTAVADHLQDFRFIF